MYKESARAIPLVFLWCLVGFVILTLFGFGWLAVEKIFVNKDTEITRSTNQYQTSTQTHLVVLQSAYNDLDAKAAQYKDNPDAVQGFRDQQKSILLQMREQAATISPDQVPPEVRAFLARH